MSDQFIQDSDGQPRLRLAAQSRRAPAPAPPQVPAPPPFVPSHEVADSPHLTDYLKVLHKRRWTASTAFLLVLASVTVYTFTATPIYEARTRLLIDAENPNVVTFKEVIDEDQAKADYYQTQYNILQSRALARKTIENLGLWEHPRLNRTAGDGNGFSVRRVIGGAFGFVTGMLSSAPAAAADTSGGEETEAQSRTIDALLDDLAISPIRNSRLVDVKFRSPDAALSTRIVNALAKNYIDQNLEYKFSASKEANDWLDGQLAEQRKEVETAEAKLQAYRERNDAISLEDRQNIVVQKLTDLNAAVTRAKTERIQKEAMYKQLRAIETNPAALDTFPAILANSFIQQQKGELAQLQQQYAQLSEKFGEKHPEIVKTRSAIQNAQLKLQVEISKVVQSVRTEYQAALAQETSMSAALGQQKSEALSMNRKGIEYSVLERDMQSSKQLYENLMQRAKETSVSSELKSSNIRVIDKAERPRDAVFPRKGLNMLLGLVSGAVLAIGLTFFFEYLDSRLKTPEEVKAHLGLPALGMVPALAPQSWKGREPLIHIGVPPGFAEAFRTIRTNVLFSSAEEGARALVITSTGPGEGKTTVASNLAIGFAQAGQRVLLIDADMRRPRVHEVFGRRQEPGLSNVMVGNAKASQSVHKTGVPGLWLLAAGHLPPNPAELLGSQRFRDFVTSLKEHFDLILIDSPPVMAVTDAVIAAHAANGVVFVVGSEMTSRQAARAAVEQLEQGRVHFVGAILNRVDLERNSYYYSNYYRHEYGSYYQKQAVNSR
ncbi:MAG TPA: polysaccharide biosynthesis tyrosine autokinase [Vicinamibacterales bacterium]|nr:polysaccharide biosynthesis tyrosine autokinase [Vicinamibacterales bacterium]